MRFNMLIKGLTLCALIALPPACSNSTPDLEPDTTAMDTPLVFPDGQDSATTPDRVQPGDAKDASDDSVPDTSKLDAPGDLTTTDVLLPTDTTEDLLSDLPSPLPDTALLDLQPADLDPDGLGETTPEDLSSDISTQPPPLFDLPLIYDPNTAHCTFENPHTAFKDGVLLDVWHVRYDSFEPVNGVLTPIQIQGFAAKPAGLNGPMPGIILAHGLGGYSEEDHATGVAALTGMFVLAYTGPGGGTMPDNTSQGTPSSAENGYHMFDVLQDPRTTWFWGHTVAAMRGITCLQTRPEVDAAKIGMTGFSAGGVATLLTAGADPRLKAGVPLSGTLAWDVAVQSPKAWQNNLLGLAGLSNNSPEWTALMQHLISPQALLASSNAAIFMVNGTTDEFFPLTAHMATYSAITAPKRTSFAANFDHGCYQLSGVESASAIEERASLRAKGAQRAWFHHHFGTDANYTALPDPPVLQATSVGAATYLAAIVHDPGSKLDPESAHVWWSGDNGFSYISQELTKQSNGVYDALVPMVLPANSVYFVDVVYKTSGLVPDRFSLSSQPVMPDEFVPAIRAMDSCF